MAEEKQAQQICICGGGNGAHVFAVISAAIPNATVNILSLYNDRNLGWESERWQTASEGGDTPGTSIQFSATNTSLTSTFNRITNDPAQAIPGSDVIVICIPAFAHEQYLRAIFEHSDKPAVISVFPGYGGVEFQFKSIFGEKANNYALVSCETLPWACRIQTYGKSVEVLGTKHEVGVSTLVNREVFGDRDVIALTQQCVGELPVLRDDGHILISTLGSTNPMIHPSIMYAQWKLRWDGQPLDEKPLFYHGLSPEGADILAAVSTEVMKIGEAAMAAREDIRFTMNHIEQWYMTCYGKDCTDTSSLHGLITTNPGYTGLTHPCVETEDGKFMPNFRYRYMTEDFPYGVVVFKGIALMLGVETPQLDMLLTWGQEVLGKEYLAADGTLSGRDIGETRAPQTYGFQSLNDAF